MLQNLKPRQQEILAILRKESVPLTNAQLQRRMGYNCENGAHRHLRALEHMGFIYPRRKFEHRAIMLSEAGRAALARKAAQKKKR